MKSFITLLLFFSFAVCVNGQSAECEGLETEWKSGKDAMEAISEYYFSHYDELFVSTSKTLRSAQFFSCDGKFGYLVVKSKRAVYIHKNVPINNWNALKEAKSIGGFYNFYIRNRYQMVPTKAT